MPQASKISGKKRVNKSPGKEHPLHGYSYAKPYNKPTLCQQDGAPSCHPGPDDLPFPDVDVRNLSHALKPSDRRSGGRSHGEEVRGTETVLTAGLAFSREHSSSLVLEDISSSIRIYTNTKTKQNKNRKLCEAACFPCSQARSEATGVEKISHMCARRRA